MKIEKVAVFGAGEMGHGIAENCAIAGYEVWMRDLTSLTQASPFRAGRRSDSGLCFFGNQRGNKTS
jgi:3-hydroxyacyl-CoA dehydrogenase